MSRKMTIADVAEKAEVSKSTVSQFLNERFEYMGEETRTRVQNAISELEYQPNVVARSLKKKSTSTIGVIVANILHAYSTQVIRAIENVCNDNGFSTIICNADDNPEKEKKYIETLLAKQVDGLIVVPISGNLGTYDKLLKQNYPIVFLDRLVDGLNTDTVLLDNERASELAVSHLLKNGYKDIAIVTTSLVDNVTPRVERINGYKSTLKANGITVRPEFIRGMELNSFNQGLDALFSLDKKPDAIISGNDLTLMEILKYTFENDIEIGKDIGLITIDEVSFGPIHSPPLTTIAQPTFEMGKEVATILLKKIKDKKIKDPVIHRHEPSIIIRNSTKKEGVSSE
ncbi:transcriptional regulator, LacI family [Virgibacillus subterraneus]|uniref:Transcriptional regulator, LacI family n=2 Tax=Virgibacillus TaxID=84406 RepID=A0A1H0Z0F1_9BACI|nr:MULTISPECIES: substrate-binding domain-containing protein [Virgibacillus]SDQ20834.1 transcriptional regulator, LacI family [Virgibacillus salinus]SEP84888.1 transcriptional regulator, LacI family [Virgibacillus subterraneus]